MIGEPINTPSFIDRESSWLDFNERVLVQCMRDDIPPNKQLEFIGIAASNLDEFISVRFAGIDQELEPVKYSYILERIKRQKQQILDFYKMYEINLSGSMDDYMHGKLSRVFNSRIYPALTPISVASNKEVPQFVDDDINFFIMVKDDDDNQNYCFLQIPHQLKRIYEIKGNMYSIENFVKTHMEGIFNNKIVESIIQFTVNKDYNEEVDHDSQENIVEKVNKVLSHRRNNNIIFMDVLIYENNTKSNKLIKYLTKLLKVPKKNIFKTYYDDYTSLGLHFLKEGKIDLGNDIDIPKNKWNPKFEPKYPEELIGEDSIYDYLNDDDLVVYHPFEDYVVIRFLEEAANDPNTITIKQTLYRVSSEKSPIIKALCKAASRGVKVTVMLELLARFDETQNVSLINTLKESGVTVVYSLESLKTHCKMCLVTKNTKKGVRFYSHTGTGNYNEKTAHVYTDISYFTSDETIGYELNSIFNMITGFSNPGELKLISYSPNTIRPTIESEILRVKDYCVNNPDKTGYVNIKVNSISDIKMVELINTVASETSNIKFNIICRGICSVPARDNVEIHSVIGRFLEHSRIYMFDAGKKTIYIASADLLTRNLDKRIETMIKITNKSCRKKISNIFDSLWEDTANSWKALPDGSWATIPTDEIYINHQNDSTMG